MLRVTVKPEMVRWARERAGRTREELNRFHLDRWESGEMQPTLKQLEDFAEATHVPIGYLFLDSPPVEQIPIPDLRTVKNQTINRPSSNMLDTIYLCQQRQAWYHDFARSSGYEPLDFVGSVSINDSVEETASSMHKIVKFDLEERKQSKTWSDALRHFINRVEDAGIMVMVNGVVGNNNNRKLDVEEFRGFALADKFAPIIFINGADARTAQMFTLTHELAHIWLGKSALTNVGPTSQQSRKVETWCNKVAAEFLVPMADLKKSIGNQNPLDAVNSLVRKYKVSKLVILRRLFDTGYLGYNEFIAEYQASQSNNTSRSSSGGDFYRTIERRTSKRFAQSLMTSALEGQTPFLEAFRLLGVKKMDTFRGVGHQLGIIA